MKVQNAKPLSLNQIRVASPCDASWDSMTGDHRSRRCDRCHLDVYNISGLSSREAVRLIQNRTGRLCIRLRRRADGTVITRDCPKGLTAYRLRVAKLAGSAFAAVIGLFSAGYSQRLPGHDSQGVRSETSSEIARIEGVVRDTLGQAIPNASVLVTTASGKVISKKTDRLGRFQLTSLLLEKGRNRLRIEANGFRSFVEEFSIRRRESIDYQVQVETGGFIGIVDIRSEPLIDPKKSGISTTFRFEND